MGYGAGYGGGPYHGGGGGGARNVQRAPIYIPSPKLTASWLLPENGPSWKMNFVLLEEKSAHFQGRDFVLGSGPVLPIQPIQGTINHSNKSWDDPPSDHTTALQAEMKP